MASIQVTSMRISARPLTTRRGVVCNALWGGKKAEEKHQRDMDDAYQKQQEVLEARRARAGRAMPHPKATAPSKREDLTPYMSADSSFEEEAPAPSRRKPAGKKPAAAPSKPAARGKNAPGKPASGGGGGLFGIFGGKK